jgi:hypothetical protein
MCKDTCHAGHEFEMKVLWAMFYCDCNDKQQCKAQSDDNVDARGNSSKKTRHRRNRTPLLPHGFTGKVQMPQVLEEEEEEGDGD